MGGDKVGGGTFIPNCRGGSGERTFKIFQKGLIPSPVTAGHSRIFTAGYMIIVSLMLKTVLLPKREANFWVSLSLGFPTQDLWFPTLSRCVQGGAGWGWVAEEGRQEVPPCPCWSWGSGTEGATETR